jgi:signal peptidase I
MNLVSRLRSSRFWPHFKSFASLVVFVWLFTNHIAQATVVPTGSMEPTILVGDHFILDKLGYEANYPAVVNKVLPERPIHRGDILAFWAPENGELKLVKRVIGIPGDVIEIRAGEIYINGQKVSEPYVQHLLAADRQPIRDMAPLTIPTDRFFMMGDNRDNSRDSRYFGLVRRDDIVGKPTFIYWSYESEPYPVGGRTIGEWVGYYASVATHFFTKTRWSRTGLGIH